MLFLGRVGPITGADFRRREGRRGCIADVGEGCGQLRRRTEATRWAEARRGVRGLVPGHPAGAQQPGGCRSASLPHLGGALSDGGCAARPGAFRTRYQHGLVEDHPDLDGEDLLDGHERCEGRRGVRQACAAACEAPEGWGRGRHQDGDQRHGAERPADSALGPLAHTPQRLRLEALRAAGCRHATPRRRGRTARAHRRRTAQRRLRGL
mmetsp:Transcript_66645/g.192533  ORF Transcript_66645/g.192533 Transcript_66645/m.192533 type:complete len:209 (+) Transcript_66645:1317-1943(+)